MRAGIRTGRAAAAIVAVFSVLAFLIVSAVPAFAVTPTIASFSPSFGPVGTVVTITGTNFNNPAVSAVKIGNKSEAFTIDGPGTHIMATVAQGTQTGPILVTNADGTATSSTNFTVAAAPLPQITSFTPTNGPAGQKVTITGTGFTGATSVTFNGVVDSTFKVVSDTEITATVPPTATTGKIAVIGPGGTGNSTTNFTVTSPFVSGFTPTIGPWGTQVVISGGNLTGATSVKFNGTGATTFSVNSGTQITATVPNSATTGPISVTTSTGTGTSTDPFTIKHLRSVSLSLSGKLRASGSVTVSDGTSACGSSAFVKIQHRVSGSWRTVGTGTTTGTGSYSIRVSKDSGKYRARGMKSTLPNGDVCGKATSGIVFH